MLTGTSISGCIFRSLGDSATKFPQNRLAIKQQGLSRPAENNDVLHSRPERLALCRVSLSSSKSLIHVLFYGSGPLWLEMAIKSMVSTW